MAHGGGVWKGDIYGCFLRSEWSSAGCEPTRCQQSSCWEPWGSATGTATCWAPARNFLPVQTHNSPFCLETAHYSIIDHLICIEILLASATGRITMAVRYLEPLMQIRCIKVLFFTTRQRYEIALLPHSIVLSFLKILNVIFFTFLYFFYWKEKACVAFRL